MFVENTTAFCCFFPLQLNFIWDKQVKKKKKNKPSVGWRSTFFSILTAYHNCTLVCKPTGNFPLASKQEHTLWITVEVKGKLTVDDRSLRITIQVTRKCDRPLFKVQTTEYPKITQMFGWARYRDQGGL